MAFDMDGTLVEASERDPERGPEKVPVRETVAAWARTLREAGHPVLVVTGRDARWRARTKKDVARIFQADIETLDDVALEMQGEWQGWREAVRKKAKALKKHDCVAIVGDQAHLDGKAADAAGIRFVDVEKALEETQG